MDELESDDGAPVRLLLGVTGSVAAAHLPDFLLHLRLRLGAHVSVMMSRRAHQFVTETTLATFSGNPVLTDDNWMSGVGRVAHVEATRDVNVFLVMPATANVLAKAAHGLADDLVSATVLASAAPVVFVPAMNAAMWGRPVTQDNVARVSAGGYRVFASPTGLELSDLRPGGVGLPRPPELSAFLVAMLAGQDAPSVQGLSN